MSPLLAVTLLAFSVVGARGATDPKKPVEETEYGVKYANSCEVCKYLVVELEGRLKETGKTHEVIETGYSFDEKKKKTKYTKSELRLIESLDGICERILEYNIHKERKDSTRFAKGMSQTFQTLHGLVDKGVKVELGIPLELWDKPSAEVTQLKTQCETLLERHEEDIENWYWKHQDQPLDRYLCLERALQKDNTGCLIETFDPTKQDDKEAEEAEPDADPKEGQSRSDDEL